MGKLDGQVALVTGAARGQGRSHAVLLASEGAAIVACDVLEDSPTTIYPMSTKADMDETARLVREAGSTCLTMKADVCSLEDMTAAANAAMDEFGQIDILLANAGILSTGLLAEMSSETWKAMIDTNLTGVFNTFRAVVPHMIAKGYGRIVATSSGGGKVGFPTLTHYTAAKWGIIGLVKSLALELCQNGITVNAVTPANVKTDMIQNDAVIKVFLPDVQDPTPDQIRAAFSSSAMGVPWMDPIDVSRVILFLVSPETKYITGETIGPLLGNGARNGAA